MSVILTNFVPRRKEISDVTNATNAVVTTTEDHGYFNGQIVRLHVPEDYGMVLRFVQATILSVDSPTSFTTDVDTAELAPYLTPSTPPGFTQSHVVPISGVEDNNTSITG